MNSNKMIGWGKHDTGGYDCSTNDLAQDSPTLTELQPLLKKADKGGIGLIGMKAAGIWRPIGH